MEYLHVINSTVCLWDIGIYSNIFSDISQRMSYRFLLRIPDVAVAKGVSICDRQVSPSTRQLVWPSKEPKPLQKHRNLLAN